MQCPHIMYLHLLTLLYIPSSDPEDYSSARRYTVTFPQTTFTDNDDPDSFAMSFPISINITDDYILEDTEFFLVHILETSDRFRVRIGQQDTVNVTIIDDDSAPSQSIHCPAEEDSVWRIQWPATVSDSIRTFCCPGRENACRLGLAHRECLSGGLWGSVDATECESVAIRDVRMKVIVIPCHVFLKLNVTCVARKYVDVHISWTSWPHAADQRVCYEIGRFQKQVE